ncbi:MAG: hypothetical protein ACOCRX_08520, partial [Candidatus Woesearchaeota archaeon]
NELKKDRIIENTKNLLKREDDLNSLKIIGRNSKYDLLNGNLVHFKMKVKEKSNEVLSSDFYKKCEEIYNKNIEKIKKMIKQD